MCLLLLLLSYVQPQWGGCTRRPTTAASSSKQTCNFTESIILRSISFSRYQSLSFPATLVSLLQQYRKKRVWLPESFSRALPVYAVVPEIWRLYCHLQPDFRRSLYTSRQWNCDEVTCSWCMLTTSLTNSLMIIIIDIYYCESPHRIACYASGSAGNVDPFLSFDMYEGPWSFASTPVIDAQSLTFDWPQQAYINTPSGLPEENYGLYTCRTNNVSIQHYIYGSKLKTIMLEWSVIVVL